MSSIQLINLFSSNGGRKIKSILERPLIIKFMLMKMCIHNWGFQNGDIQY